jgi:polysaccharide biosynthesis PFTS motif protein
MPQKLILTSKIKFSWLFNFFEIYGRKLYLNNSCKRNVIVKDDIFSASDYRKCDNEASSIEERLLTSLVNSRRVGFLTKWGGRTYTKYFLGEQVVKDAQLIILTFRYAEKIRTHYDIQGYVYIWSSVFSWKIYKEIEKIGALPENIKLSFLMIVYIKLYNTAKYFYLFFKTLFYLENIIFKIGRSKGLDTYKLKNQSIVHLDDSMLAGYPNLDNTIVEDKIFKLFSKKDTLFVNDTQSHYQWEKYLTKFEYSVLVLDDVIFQLSRNSYLLNYYIAHCKFRISLLLLSLSSPWLMHSCYKALRYRVLWEIFYDKSSFSNVIRMMTKEDLTSSTVHKKYGTKTIFTYFSTTENIIDHKVDNNKSSCLDYTHMISDYVVSSPISNNWLKTHENRVGEYIPLGPIFSSIIKEGVFFKNKTKNELNIPNNAKVISFLDHTFGFQGVLTIDAYNNFIETILLLSEKNKNIFYLFKSKKSLEQIELNAGKKTVAIIQRIREKNNTIYVNDYNIDSLKLISMSDLVVSAPMSSVIFESLFGGVKTIVYDPVGQYMDYISISVQLIKGYCVNPTELESLIDYWMMFTVNEKIKCHLLNSTYKNFNNICDNNLIDKYRNFIKKYE